MGSVKCVLAEFRNEAIPNTRVAPFSYVKANISFKDNAGREVQHVSSCAWAGHDGDTIDIEPGGDSVWVIVALCVERHWEVATVKSYKDYTLDVFGEDSFKVQKKQLPMGVLNAAVVLTDENGISLPAQTVKMELGDYCAYKIFA